MPRSPQATEYMRQWRKTLYGQAYLMASKRREKARRRAVRDLIENHEDEYARLLVKHVRIVEAEFEAEQRAI